MLRGTEIHGCIGTSSEKIDEAPGIEPVSLLFGSGLICLRSPALLTGLAAGSPFSKEKEKNI